MFFKKENLLEFFRAFNYACKTLNCFLFYLVNARMTFDELAICRPNPEWGTDGSSGCSFMAAFVPHAACLALRVGNGAIMRCICGHVLRPSPARARDGRGEVSCLPACLGACMLGESFMVGLGCPPCKKDRNHTKARGFEKLIKCDERERERERERWKHY